VREAAAVDDRYDLRRREQRLDPQRFPAMTVAGRIAFGDPDHRFERSVRRLVAAFERWDQRG
jgi:hypothetical protein